MRVRLDVGTVIPRLRPRIHRGLLAACAWAAAIGCNAEPPGSSRDDGRPPVGSEVANGQTASRIISLVPSATQTLHALGALETLVGRTDFDVQPWAASIPSVGGGLGPNLEAIVALRPDLVIRFAGEQDPRTVERLDELGIPHLSVRPDHVADIYSMTHLLGGATGRTSAADSLVARMRAGLATLASALDETPPLRVAYVLGGAPPLVAGPDTYISEILSMVGGINVFADLEALYAAVSPEEFRVRQIDVVLVSGPSDFNPDLAPDARVVTVGADLEMPGPHIVEAAEALARALHGGSE